MEDVGLEVERMRAELRKTVLNADDYKQNGGHTPLLPPEAFDPDTPDNDGDAYGAFEQQRQVEILHEQDEALDGVFQTVGNLRRQADDMGRELEEQAVMLDDVTNVADRVGGKIQNGIKKAGWVIKKNEGTICSWLNHGHRRVLADVGQRLCRVAVSGYLSLC